MRITADVVRELATGADEAMKAAAAANGWDAPDFHYGGMYGGPGDDGATRFVASHKHLAWGGRDSARRAAAYYLGVIDAFRGTAYLDLPHQDNREVRRAGPNEYPAVRDALFQSFTGEVLRQYGEGLDEGNSRRRTLASEHARKG